MNFIEKFLNFVEMNPSKTAISRGDKKVSYSDFAILAFTMAEQISHIKAKRVLIDAEQGTLAYATMVGSVLAGATYSILNPETPAIKANTVKSCFDPDLVISERNLGASDISLKTALNCMRKMHRKHHAEQSPAYVFFTSGSTGHPKGVSISISAIDHFIENITKVANISSTDILLQQANIAFDLSVFDIFCSLNSGATLAPCVTKREKLFPAEVVLREGVTVWNSVPSLINLVRSADMLNLKHFRTVRLFSFCGEPLKKIHVESIFSANPTASIMNMYGPTEATVAVTAKLFSKDDELIYHNNTVGLGAPLGKSEIFLLPENLNRGEIHICGPQLANEYWKDKLLTETHFIDVTRNGSTVRSFASKDEAIIKKGEYFFTNRLNRTHKIKGLRIDLGEIEAAAEKIGTIQSHCLFLKEKLILFIEGDLKVSEKELLSHLQNNLEPEFIPQDIFLLEKFPFTVNGKINTHKLEIMALEKINNA